MDIAHNVIKRILQPRLLSYMAFYDVASTTRQTLASGLADALQTPQAALTVFAPTDVAWLRSYGRLNSIITRAAGTYTRPLISST
jgi:hypothetical protein